MFRLKHVIYSMRIAWKFTIIDSIDNFAAKTSIVVIKMNAYASLYKWIRRNKANKLKKRKALLAF